LLKLIRIISGISNEVLLEFLKKLTYFNSTIGRFDDWNIKCTLFKETFLHSRCFACHLTETDNIETPNCYLILCLTFGYTSHNVSGQLSLAVPQWVGTVSASES